MNKRLVALVLSGAMLLNHGYLLGDVYVATDSGVNFIQDVTTSDHSGLAQNQARFKVYGNNMDKSISMVVFKEIEDSDMEKFAPDIFVIGGKK